MRTRQTCWTAAMLLSALLAAGCVADAQAPAPPAETGDNGAPSAPPEQTSGNATLSWQPPAERMDGSPLLNLAGYRILYGQESGRYSYTIEIDNAGITRYFIDGLGAGPWFFAVVAIDSEGLESPPSAEVSKVI